MAENNKPQSKPGIIMRFIGNVLTVAMWLFFALIMSIISEWVGMNISWEDEGVAHSQNMYKKELGYLNKDFKQSLVVSTPVVFASKMAGTLYEYLFQKTGIENYIVKGKRQRVKKDPIFNSIEKYVLSAMYITQVFAIRLAIMILAIPAFLIVAAIASVEGLVSRDIRKWELGREHSALYHYAKRIVPFLFIAPWVIYLAIPYSVHPNAIILPFIILFGIAIGMVTYLFKKYI